MDELVPERYTILGLGLNKARDDGVVVESTEPCTNHLYNAPNR